MSVKASDAVWAHSKMTGSARLVMLAIASFADANGMAWPGIERLSDMVGVTQRSVQRAIQQCEEAGELAVERSAGRGNTNVYRILLIGKGDANVTIAEDEKVTPVSPIEKEKVTSVTEKVTSVTKKGDASVTRSVIEPSEEPSRERETPAPTAFWTIPDALKTEGFIKAWGLWLKHVDESGLIFTETQAALKLAELEEAGADLAENSIMVSLRRGWRNVYISHEGMVPAGASVNGHRGKVDTEGLVVMSGGEQFVIKGGKPVRLEDART